MCIETCVYRNMYRDVNGDGIADLAVVPAQQQSREPPHRSTLCRDPLVPRDHGRHRSTACTLECMCLGMALESWLKYAGHYHYYYIIRKLVEIR